MVVDTYSIVFGMDGVTGNVFLQWHGLFQWCGTGAILGVVVLIVILGMVWILGMIVHVYSVLGVGGTCVVVVSVWRFHGY